MIVTTGCYRDNLCSVIFGIINKLLLILEFNPHLFHRTMYIVVLCISKQSSDNELYFLASMISGFLWLCLFYFLALKNPFTLCREFSNAQVRSIIIVPGCLLLVFTAIHIISIYIFIDVWVCLIWATISWLYLDIVTICILTFPPQHHS